MGTVLVLGNETVREVRRWLYAAADHAVPGEAVRLTGAAQSQPASDLVAARVAVFGELFAERIHLLVDGAERWQSDLQLVDLDAQVRAGALQRAVS